MSKTVSSNPNFIERSKEIHGNKYDYSLVPGNAKGHVKVKIICANHGIFMQTFNNHIHRKSKCPDCSILIRSEKRRVTKKEFLTKANIIHKNKFIYDLVNFNEVDFMKNKNIIVCPEHGEFLQTLKSHLTGRECPDCSLKRRGDSSKLTGQEFVNKCQIVHGDLYDYSLFEYKGRKIKGQIICKLHGIFLKSPDDHIDKSLGCNMCSKYKSNGERFTYTAIKEIVKNPIETNKTIRPFKNKKRCLFADFVFEFNSKKYAVEFNGMQHYIDRCFKFKCHIYEKSRDKFRIVRKNDRVKKKYFLENNYIFIVIDGRKFRNYTQIKNYLLTLIF